METYTLFELNQYIRQVIALNFVEQIWVRCELSEVNRSRGHWYISLVEKDPEGQIIAQSQAVLWRGTSAMLQKKLTLDLSSILQTGMEVALAVRVDFHERYGLKLFVEDVDTSYTLGKLAAQRQAIIDSLRSRNLLEKNRTVLLPNVIQRIAVISSETAAGLADFQHTLENNEYGYDFKISLFPASVQGDKLEPEVAAQLKTLAKHQEDYDIVAIVRGGGSRLDLAGFDSEKLGELIANHPLPVFTGIGHETDETVCDLVAHTRLKTPSALAAYIIESNRLFEESLILLANRIREASRHVLQTESLQLERIGQFTELYFRQFFQREREWAMHMQERLTTQFKYKLTRERDLLEKFNSLYQSYHPQNTLDRGYSITLADGRIIKSSQDLKKGEIIDTVLARGKITSTFISVTENQHENDL